MSSDAPASQPEADDRARQLRQTLVATANLGPYVRRRPPLKLVIGAITAFVLAGALTGGGIAAATTADPTVSDAQAQAAASAKLEVGVRGGSLLGKPFVVTTAGNTAIQLGHAPRGATDVVEGFGCIDSGDFASVLDSRRFAVFADCGSGSGEFGSTHVSVPGMQVVDIRAAKGTRFTAWISWAKIPKLVASAAQKAALSDQIVSRDEVIAAFSRYEGCMGALGHPMNRSLSTIVPPDSATSAEVVDGSDERCFVTEYRDVDEHWQLELQAGTMGQASVAACTASGQLGERASDPSDAHRAIATMQGLLPDYSECPWVG
jgi:hypothetical protein